MGTCSSTGKASRRRSGGHGVSPRTNKNKNKSKGKAKNKKLEDDYTVGKLLGKGHYGSVFKGTSKATGKVVAVKMIDRAKSRAKRLQLEVKILRKVSRMGGGELFDSLVEQGPMSERQAAQVTRKLASALKYMHKRGVVHRDLKPENILLADKNGDGNVKLADFGLSRFIREQDQLMHTVCGTWAYSAPEVRIHRKGYTSAVDMWSLGVIIFVILSGYHPFDPEGIASEDELQSNIKRGRFDFDDPVWDTVSDSAKELIESLIRLDPADRLDCRAILAHPWVKKYTPRLHKKHRTSQHTSVEHDGMSRATSGEHYHTSASLQQPHDVEDNINAATANGTSRGRSHKSRRHNSQSSRRTHKRKHRRRKPKDHRGRGSDGGGRSRSSSVDREAVAHVDGNAHASAADDDDPNLGHTHLALARGQDDEAKANDGRRSSASAAVDGTDAGNNDSDHDNNHDNDNASASASASNGRRGSRHRAPHRGVGGRKLRRVRGTSPIGWTDDGTEQLEALERKPSADFALSHGGGYMSGTSGTWLEALREAAHKQGGQGQGQGQGQGRGGEDGGGGAGGGDDSDAGGGRHHDVSSPVMEGSDTDSDDSHDPHDSDLESQPGQSAVADRRGHSGNADANANANSNTNANGHNTNTATNNGNGSDSDGSGSGRLSDRTAAAKDAGAVRRAERVTRRASSAASSASSASSGSSSSSSSSSSSGSSSASSEAVPEAPVRIMEMDSGEIVQGGDFDLVDIARAPSPGNRRRMRRNRRERRKQRKKREKEGDAQQQQQQQQRGRSQGRRRGGNKKKQSRRGDNKHSQSRRAMGMGLASFRVRAPTPPHRQRLAREVEEKLRRQRGGGGMSMDDADGGGVLANMKSDEVLVADNDADDMADVHGGVYGGGGGGGGGDGGGGGGVASEELSGLMAELAEGEVMSAELSDEELAADTGAPVTGILARLDSGQTVSTTHDEGLEGLSDSAEGAGAAVDAVFGFVDAMESGEEITENMSVGSDSRSLGSAAAPLQGEMARLDSGEEATGEFEGDTNLDDMGLGAQSRRLAAAAAADAPVTGALAKNESGEVFEEDMEGVDLANMPNIFSRASRQHMTAAAVSAAMQQQQQQQQQQQYQRSRVPFRSPAAPRHVAAAVARFKAAARRGGGAGVNAGGMMGVTGGTPRGTGRAALRMAGSAILGSSPSRKALRLGAGGGGYRSSRRR